MESQGRPGSDRAVLAARAVAGLVAVIVFVDAWSVGAPGLALLGLPFLLGAVLFRGRSRWSDVLVGAFALLYVVVGARFVAVHGFDAGWGDLLFGWVGTPLALALVVMAALLLRQRARS